MLMQYNPVTYNKREDTTGTRYPGLIAEEVAEMGANYFVEFDESGNPLSLDYARINVHLIKCIQELNEILKKQQKAIDVLIKNMRQSD